MLPPILLLAVVVAAVPADSRAMGGGFCDTGVDGSGRCEDTRSNVQVLLQKRTALSFGQAVVVEANDNSRVDVVVERHCEDLSWLEGIPMDLRPRLRVFIYDKPGGKCPPVAQAELPEGLLCEVRELPNHGRDGDDQLTHIIEHYDDLGTHTVFLQAQNHIGRVAHFLPAKVHRWRTQVDVLAEVVPGLSDSDLFVPLTGRSDRGPVLFQDREDDTDPDDFDTSNHVKFDTGWSDQYMRGKEFYFMLFGGTPCEAAPQIFSPGMQYVVHRSALRRRSLDFWKGLKTMLLNCRPHMGYAFERLTTSIYNGSAEARDPSAWGTAAWCEAGTSWADFTTPLDRMKSAQFWRSRWGCEPLSQRLLDMHAAGKI